jgi:RNA polymerase sigma-70 factor (ECF subfamily)
VLADFEQQVSSYQQELFGHCYRMLGSLHDAEDVVQDTLLRAWRSRQSFDADRGSLRSWLHGIATNACLDALRGRRARPLPSGVGSRFDDPDAALVDSGEVPWLVPVPVDPATRAVERGRLRLALVAALQLLPARQRAVLLLREVLQLPASEVASILDTSVAGVNSALQRARAALQRSRVDLHAPADPPRQQRVVVERYLAAFENADVRGIVALLAEDVVLEMPPMWNWYAGPDAYAGFMRRVYRMRGAGWHGVALWANGEAGFAAYLDGRLHSIQVLTTEAGRVVRTSVFADPSVFAPFRLPAMLPRSSTTRHRGHGEDLRDDR